MITGIRLEDGEYGRRAVATSDWSDDLTNYLRETKIFELELNDGKGWKGKDISFLADLPHLRSFKIIDLRILSDSPMHFLHELQALEVITYCKTEMAFSSFPKLETCALEWRPKAASLFGCTTLKKLFVNRYDGRDISRFTNLVNLESLAILNAPVQNLQGLSALERLRCLRLANLRRLTSLAGIEGLINLRKLDIHACRAVESIEKIGFLPKLQELYLNDDGDIASLKPLARLRDLRSMIFYESTNIIDGDLSPLLRQENLARISFQNRRHYSHTREDFGAAYAR